MATRTPVTLFLNDMKVGSTSMDLGDLTDPEDIKAQVNNHMALTGSSVKFDRFEKDGDGWNAYGNF
jgi:hypothetical protein